MNIAIIDADLIGRSRHKFPNLACEKISGFYKKQNENVTLKLDYDNLDQYDKVYVSKVFTDTVFPSNILEMKNVFIGGTGFFYDKAPNLEYEIEHTFPDYHLYDKWIEERLKEGKLKKQFAGYTDYSIGFLTRGCFRKCEFCVNQKYNHVFEHSPLNEFYDKDRKKICLLDDNFLGCSNWEKLIKELINTGKYFTFKQGLDERILTDEKCEMLFSAKYDGRIFFAFDNIDDYSLIEKKLKMIRNHSNKNCSFYVLCGFDKEGKYDSNFWYNDLINTFKRIELLIKYRCYPYIMRFNKYKESPYKGMYITLASWANQLNYFKKLSFIGYCQLTETYGSKSANRYLKDFLKCNMEFDKKYLNMSWEHPTLM